MFKSRIEVTIISAKLFRRKRKKGDEEKGDLLNTLKIEVPFSMKLAKELGPGPAALMKSKNDNDPKVMPFEKTTLPDKPEAIRLSVFDDSGVKFEVDGCKVKKMELERAKGSPSKAVFNCDLQVPPMKQQDMSYLNRAVGGELEIALTQPQQDLDLG
jgi:hypothetical protein